jgi:hypothetical protein
MKNRKKKKEKKNEWPHKGHLGVAQGLGWFQPPHLAIWKWPKLDITIL